MREQLDAAERRQQMGDPFALLSIRLKRGRTKEAFRDSKHFIKIKNQTEENQDECSRNWCN
jgi:hypothetical protein